MSRQLSGEAYKELTRQTVDVLTLVDETGVIQYESPSITRILGYEPDELEGESVFEYVHPDDRRSALDTFYSIIEADEDYTSASVELRFRHEDGSWTWLESRGSNQTATALEGFLISSRDVSERKEYEQQLKRERDRSERFASVLSHDLRNPINVIEGRLTLARDECESEHLDRMEDSVDRVNELITDLLSLIREGEADPCLDVVDLRETIEECWENSRTEDAILRIETDQTIIADGRQLKQVLENLFRNAIEHGGSDVTVTVGPLDDGFYVEDDGRGISEDARASLLESGFSTKSDGTGLGLSIVSEIVENHEWTLHVPEDGNARFEIRDVDSE